MSEFMVHTRDLIELLAPQNPHFKLAHELLESGAKIDFVLTTLLTRIAADRERLVAELTRMRMQQPPAPIVLSSGDGLPDLSGLPPRRLKEEDRPPYPGSEE